MASTDQNNIDIEILSSCQIDPQEVVDQPPVAIAINSEGGPSPSFTLGNFSMVIGKAKSKKTFLIGAMAASAITGEEKLEMITGSLPDNKRKVLYFDTEQSRYHATRTVNRIARLTGIDNSEILKAYSLRKFKAKDRLHLIEKAIYTSPGVGLVFIDGGRDLLSAINDETQATDVTSMFLKWTEEKEIHLVVVLHQNKNDLHARGHFGSECVNKAETTISVTESRTDMSVSIVSCEYSRERAFPDFTFRISDEGLPQGCEMSQSSNRGTASTTPTDVDESIHLEVLDEIFTARQSYGYTLLWTRIKQQFAEHNIEFGDNKAKEYVTYYLGKGWLVKSNRIYTLGDLE